MRSKVVGALAVILLGVVWHGAASAAASPADVRRVLAALDADDFAAARSAAAAARDPLLATFVEWRTLRDGPEAPFSAYADFLEEHRGWPDEARLQVRAEGALDVVGNDAAVRAFFAARDPRTGNGRRAQLDALANAGGIDGEVASLARRVWIDNEFGAGEEELFLLRYGRTLGPAEHSARLDRLLWDGRLTDARRMFGRVPSDQVLLAEARIALQQGSRQADRVLAAVPTGLRADPGLAFDRMRWRNSRGQAAGVEEILLSVTDESRRPDDWWAERNRAMRRALDAADHRRAYNLLARHRLPVGGDYAEAEWQAGWLALRFLGDPQGALRHFERFSAAVSTPISRARGAYWTARAHAALGDASAAAFHYGEASAYPTTFYGQLAAAELDRPLRFPDALPPPPDERARTASRQREPFRMAEHLCAAGAHREAAPFMRQLGTEAGTDADRLELVYDLARRCARPDYVVVVAKAAVLQGAEPLPTFPIPDVAAMLSPPPGHPPAEMLLAIARQESQFDARAVSRAGARGIMQLMPTTARGVARTLALPFDLAALTDDPDFNVQLGGWYLARQLDRFGGHLPLAAAAYNAGPGRVDEWLGRFGDPRGRRVADLVDWIEQIPFAETRNYVQRVMEGVAVYAALLEQGQGRLVPLSGSRQAAAALFGSEGAR